MTNRTEIKAEVEANYYNSWSVEIKSETPLTSEQSAAINTAIETIRGIMQPKFDLLAERWAEEAQAEKNYKEAVKGGE